MDYKSHRFSERDGSIIHNISYHKSRYTKMHRMIPLHHESGFLDNSHHDIIDIWVVVVVVAVLVVDSYSFLHNY